MKISYRFKNPLLEGEIISRPNRFLMQVIINHKKVLCYCPVTSKLNIDFMNNNPCLISLNSNTRTKYKHTVEAISFELGSKKHKKWIGINQTKINNYLYYILHNNQMPEIVGEVCKIGREVRYGKSKFDFLINDQYIEVKTFLNYFLIRNVTNDYARKPAISDHRFIQQYKDILKLSKHRIRSKILYCYMYDAYPQESAILEHYSTELKSLIKSALLENIEHWQVNLSINRTGVSLLSYTLIPT